MSDRLERIDVFDQGLRTFVTFVPTLLAFVAILAIGWVVARAMARLCRTTLTRIGFRQAAERGGIHRMLSHTRYDATAIVGKLVYYAVMLVTLQVAFSIWGPNPVNDLIRGAVAWLPQAAIAVVIVVVTASVSRAVGDIVATALGTLSYGRLVARVASYAVIGLGLIAALNQIGVAITVTMPVLVAALATAGGILVVGVGGGLVRPMQQRWERLLARAEDERQQIAEHVEAYAAGHSDTTTRYVVASGAHAAGEVEGGWPTLDETQQQPRSGSHRAG